MFFAISAYFCEKILLFSPAYAYAFSFPSKLWKQRNTRSRVSTAPAGRLTTEKGPLALLAGSTARPRFASRLFGFAPSRLPPAHSRSPRKETPLRRADPRGISTHPTRTDHPRGDPAPTDRLAILAVIGVQCRGERRQPRQRQGNGPSSPRFWTRGGQRRLLRGRNSRDASCFYGDGEVRPARHDSRGSAREAVGERGLDDNRGERDHKSSPRGGRFLLAGGRVGGRRGIARGFVGEQRRGEVPSDRSAEQPSAAERVREELLCVQRVSAERRRVARRVGLRGRCEAGWRASSRRTRRAG